MARQLRALLSRLEDLQVIVDLGEYRPGENPDNDHAMQQRSALEAWLRQDRHQASAPQQTLEAMHALLA
jgi:type III secretion protein N (ATPase)